MEIIKITDEEVNKILSKDESHFFDIKSKQIKPASLTKTISAFSNADGGELFVGIEDDKTWNGFTSPEEANGHIQIFESLFPLGAGYHYQFFNNDKFQGFVLKIDVEKNPQIKYDSQGNIYIRRSAQNLKITTAEEIERLRRNKGISSFETETVNTDIQSISNSETIISFMLEIVPLSEPDAWLRKQHLIVGALPTVAGILLYNDLPQALLPKRCGIKVCRYSTKDNEEERESLVGEPESIEGNLYEIIHKTVNFTVKIMNDLKIMTADGLVNAQYPYDALFEIITNAVIHRDYSIIDDILIKIFDNRIEILSPGLLPAHITPDNILDERFSRNGTIVRLINKFPNPPNKDIGEGLNTAFNAMRHLRLKYPEITQDGYNVKVTLKHESIGSPEELIMQYLSSHETIANRDARVICNIGSENSIKHILRKMVDANMIEVVRGKTVFETKYKRKQV